MSHVLGAILTPEPVSTLQIGQAPNFFLRESMYWQITGRALTLRRDRQADALFRIALALRNSRTSFSNSLIRCASSVVVPGRVPWSIWAFLTQVRRASGVNAKLVGDPANRALGPRRVSQRVQRPSSWLARAAHRDTSSVP